MGKARVVLAGATAPGSRVEGIPGAQPLVPHPLLPSAALGQGQPAPPGEQPEKSCQQSEGGHWLRVAASTKLPGLEKRLHLHSGEWSQSPSLPTTAGPNDRGAANVLRLVADGVYF